VKGVKEVKAKGRAVVGRPETRVDGNSSLRAKKLVFQVSNTGSLWGKVFSFLLKIVVYL
jgi:hypothetical protein